jgi:filamentous hemagglutinin family protein
MGHSAAAWCFASLLGLGLALLGAPHAASGQGRVVRDGSVGPIGPEEVGPGTDPLGVEATYLITPELGEQHGSNLFHSFLYFDVGMDETATFTGPDPVEGPQSVSNVISRVTGGESSEIDGTLRSTIPGADLWLLNPSGVMFGEGARLDVGGSFHASTGDYLGFGEDGLIRFYAKEHPDRPSVLSTARPEAFGFLEESTPGPIALEPGASLGTELEGEGAVAPGERLELVGGDVSLTDAEIVAPGAHVHLEAQGDVELTRSTVDVSGEAPGSVSIRGGRLVMQGGAVPEERSLVLAENRGEEQDEGGRIEVEASESVLVDDSLLSVTTASSGDAGTIHVTSPTVTFQNGPGVLDVIDYRSTFPRATAVGASAETEGSGAGGTIDIEAGSLVVTDGASVSARSQGWAATGDAGRIDIVADSVRVSSGSDSRGADISAAAWGSQGNGGAISIQTDVLRLHGTRDEVVTTEEAMSERGYAQIWTSSAGPYAGLPPPEPVRVPGAPGRIEIAAGHIEITNGGGIDNGCWGCSSKRSDVERPERAGTVEIRAESMRVAGQNESWGSFVVVQAGDYVGDAGDLVVDLSGPLSLESGGGLGADVLFGRGDAGTIRVRADSIDIRGIARFPARIANSRIAATSQDSGKAGDISVEARTVSIESGGAILAWSSSSPFVPAGGGNAGEIHVSASESISVSNEGGEPFSLSRALFGVLVLPIPGIDFLPVTGIITTTILAGEGGPITLNAPEVTVSHGALVTSATVGGGDGGKVLLWGDRIRIIDGGNVNSSSLVWPFNRDEPILGGAGGDVELVASESIEVAGSAGPGGNLVLVAPRIVIEDGGIVQTTALRFKAFGPGNARAGDITLDAADQVIVRRGGLVDASSFVPDPEEGGNSGGNVVVTAGRSIRVEGEGSRIESSRIESRTGGRGTGGDVTIQAREIAVTNGAVVSARSAPGYQGVGFEILENDGLLANEPDFEKIIAGNAGGVSLVADEVLLSGGHVATNATDDDASDGGDVTVEAKDLLHLDDGHITAAVAGGTGGNITIDPEVVILQNESHIEASASTTGAGGRIQITADNYFAFPGSVVSATAPDPSR